MLTVRSSIECIVYTWDYHSSISFWTGLRVQPILADEVQTFKALITVHKVLQEGHPVVRIYVTSTVPATDSKIPADSLDYQGGPRPNWMAGDMCAYCGP